MTQYITVAADDRAEARNGVIKLHGPEGFEGMRRAGRLAAEILDGLVPHVVPGVTTQELDDLVRTHMVRAGATPATLGYRGYTRSSCISINHVVCHGIPSEKTLKDGDIVNIDVTPILDGWHGDSSRMYLVGNVGLKARKLVEVTYECLMLGLEQARPGNHLGDIAHAIQRHAEAQRYSVVRDFCGHGLGRLFHDSPEVIHAGRPGTGPELKPGMFFTVEPMINLGRPRREGAGRRLDGRDSRPLAVGAVRTFDWHHRDRLRDLHAEPGPLQQAALRLTCRCRPRPSGCCG